jgi:hypothetical protein
LTKLSLGLRDAHALENDPDLEQGLTLKAELNLEDALDLVAARLLGALYEVERIA